VKITVHRNALLQRLLAILERLEAERSQVPPPMRDTTLSPVEFARLVGISARHAREIFYQLDPEKTVRVGKRRRMPWAVYRKFYAKEI
jgi:hypothetical protein